VIIPEKERFLALGGNAAIRYIRGWRRADVLEGEGLLAVPPTCGLDASVDVTDAPNKPGLARPTLAVQLVRSWSLSGVCHTPPHFTVGPRNDAAGLARALWHSACLLTSGLLDFRLMI
jgi:hypothetical protein